MLKINQNIFGDQFPLIILMVLIVLLTPFYFYASGLPQPAHVLILLSSCFVLFINRGQVVDLLKLHKYGILFLTLLLAINSLYAAIYQNISFVINSVYWFFNFGLFVALLVVIRNRVVFSWLTYLIAFKFAMIVFSYLVGWGGYEFWPRYDYFFNGPNQLAYFALCLFLVYIVVTRFEINLIFFVVYAMLISIVLSSGGRSAYLALVPLVVLLVFSLRRRLTSVALVLLIPFLVDLSFSHFELPNVSRDKISSVSSVNHNTLDEIFNLTLDEDGSLHSIVLQLSARGYLRAVEHPWYMLYGAGQGYDDRFVDRYGYAYEIHSSIFAVLFYYGLIGLVLFLYFLWRVFDLKINILWMSPLFVYGLFTFGLRSPYFWVALAFLSTAPNLFQLTKNSISNYRN